MKGAFMKATKKTFAILISVFLISLSACDKADEIKEAASNPPEDNSTENNESETNEPKLNAPVISYENNNYVFTRFRTIEAFAPQNTGGMVDGFTVTPALPDELALNELTGEISGKVLNPMANTKFTITATNTTGAGSFEIEITINDIAPQISLDFETLVLDRNETFQTVSPHNIGGNITAYSIDRALPDGLELDTETGILSGTAGAPTGVETYLITATNSQGESSVNFDIQINEIPPQISYNPSSITLTSWVRPDNITPISSGGVIESYSINPALPEGLTFDSETGIISGKALSSFPQAGYTITASNIVGSSSTTINLGAINISTGTVWRIAVGKEHACVLSKQGAVKCWGSNEYAQLGNGTTNDSSEPVPVTGMENGVTYIDAGEYHTCVLKNGGAYCWGSDLWAESGGTAITICGADKRYCRKTPVQISASTLTGLTGLAVGANHTCVIRSDLRVVSCWGRNDYYQLGTYNMNCVGYRYCNRTPTYINGFTGSVLEITAGKYHTCAFEYIGNSERRVKCWGGNNYEQLGVNGAGLDYSKDPVLVSELPIAYLNQMTAGYYHNCVASPSYRQNFTSCWGSNSNGQMGTDMAIGADRFTFRLQDPKKNEDGEVVKFLNISRLIAGVSHTCGTDRGDMWCWGSNNYGQLGDNSTDQKRYGERVMMNDNGTLKPLTGVVEVDAHYAFNCALINAGRIFCWGDNSKNQLGNPSVPEGSFSSVAVQVEGF